MARASADLIFNGGRVTIKYRLDRPEFQTRIDSEEFERKYGQRPLAFDPDGDNGELLQELNRQYKRKSSGRAARGWSPLERPTPVVDLLPPADQSYFLDLLFEVKFSEQQAAKGKKSPKYKRIIESGIERVLRKEGVETAAKKVWNLLVTEEPQEYCFQLFEGEDFYFKLDDEKEVLSVEELPSVEGATLKKVPYGTFKNYVTKVKKELTHTYEAWFLEMYEEINARRLRILADLKKESE
ncbi:MAG: hypothetical protein IH936_00370 [Acidobacteria bacterium]|nr:hypothetical protein [Acidobacteriota bacterium]